MASPIDSEAHFRERASTYGLPADLLQALIEQDVKTLGQLAFAIFRPGTDYDETVFNNWARTVNNNVAPSIGALGALRRLHFEAEIAVTSSLKSSIEVSDANAPKPIPTAERNARLDDLRRRLGGLSIHGAAEPKSSTSWRKPVSNSSREC